MREVTPSAVNRARGRSVHQCACSLKGRRVAETGQRLGQILVRTGVISERQLHDALEAHKGTGAPLGRVLVDLGYASHIRRQCANSPT